MAAATARVSMDEVREQVKKMQNEGERLVARIRRDARGLLSPSRQEVINNLVADVRKLQADLRQRAETTLKDLDTRRAKLRATVEEQVTRVVETVVKRLNLASTDDLGNLRRRIDALEKQVNVLAREVADEAKQRAKGEKAA